MQFSPIPSNFEDIKNEFEREMMELLKWQKTNILEREIVHFQETCNHYCQTQKLFLIYLHEDVFL